MDILFKISFIYKDSSFENIDLKFYEKNVFDNNQEIKENKLIDIKFECENVDARLYMDGLEMLPERFTKIDEEGRIYIEPTEEHIPFYNIDLYPLIPGTYTAKVVINEKIYYSSYKVVGKLLSHEEVEKIKMDLEKEISGLAFDLVRRNMGSGEKNKINNLPEKIYKFYLIKDNMKVISSALMDLKIRPNYKIKKIYKNKLQENAGELDDRAIRLYLSERNKQGFIRSPIKKIDYDLPENRWIKKIIESMVKVLNNFTGAAQDYLKEQRGKLVNNDGGFHRKENILENIRYITELISIANQMRNTVNIIKATEWYGSLSNKNELYIPNVLIQDVRYNSLYKIYKELNKKEFSVEIDEKFSLQWKRTDYLYEMWCFIKICKILKNNLEYEISGEWIDSLAVSKNILIPEIKSGKRIVFKKEDIVMNFIYDEKVPYNSIKTKVWETPVYAIQPNNRPDGRLDIYKNHIYQGSVIFEFKYRDKKNLWNEHYIEKFNEIKVIKQLISYSTFKSIYYKGFKENKAKRCSPIYQVITLYPKSKHVENEIDEITDNNITFLKFRPEINEQLLNEQLNQIINEIVE